MKIHGVWLKLASVLALLTGSILIFIYYYQTAGGRLPTASHLYTVNAEVQDPQGLLKHADVRAAGVKIGSVSNLSNIETPDGLLTDVQMQFTDKSYAPIYKNATVLVRQKTLVGENYIAVTRGLPKYGAVPDGGTLPVSQDLGAVPLDDILNALTGPIRADVQSDLKELGDGVHGQGNNINEFLNQLQPTVSSANTVVTILNKQKTQVADVAQQAGTVLTALADRTQELRNLITGGTQFAQAIANRDNALEATFTALPGTLAQAQTSVNKLNTFAGTATPVIANLKTAVTNLHPVLQKLAPTAVAAKSVFTDLKPFLTQANPLISKLTTLANAGSSDVPDLSTALREINPGFDYLKPYYKDVGSFLENFGGSEMLERDNGDYIGRCLCPISIESYSGLTGTEQNLIQALIKAGGLGDLAYPNHNGLRAPATEPNASYPFSGAFPRLTEAAPVALKKSQ